ncbi:two-component system, OmpR family, sensor histidine kinase [Oryzomicrobium terrae]|uniref:histidine kinase n=1 Tax=Oryzomicrobium terrae TaxID=1735038 RepID=A0A5C1E5W0_9RHOO|nr:sensor histidine kinase [Oryzomicrobium terrae]QEL64253.1 two-component system, OmpR family, sensor histidine kinase [Oryzomicrobium terrae]
MKRPASLRGLLLRWLLPATVLFSGAAALTAYGIAFTSASHAYDRALLDTALALSEQVRVFEGQPYVTLTRQAQQILLTDRYDRVFYEVVGPGGEFVSGHRGLPRPTDPMVEDDRVYYDGWYGGEQVRVAALALTKDGIPVLVLAAETDTKRGSLAREILLGMLLPVGALLLMTLGFVWYGIRAGLRPLEALREELAQRSHHDLRPVETPVPVELQPVINEVNQLLARLDLSLASQRSFVSDAAHQLRTPIAALQAQVELALDEGNPETRRRQLDQIRVATARLSHLAHQLLALARAEPGGLSTSEPLSLPDIAHQCAEIWLPAALKKGIDLGFELEPATVQGSPLLLQELLGNLVDNAIRYTPGGGTVTVRCGVIDGQAFLGVDDDGPGVAPADREAVFNRFHRVAGSPGDGCGLGLAIVREIARQHGGDVRLGDAPGGGARFTVVLPLAPSTALPRETPRP